MADRGELKLVLWLGHSHTQTIEAYTHSDPSEKLEAVNAITPPKLRKGRFKPTDNPSVPAIMRAHQTEHAVATICRY
jgi:hypothetical protein